LILDELTQLSFGEAATVVYTLTGEVGKGRLRSDATARTPYSWRTLLLSSGETPIASRISEDRHQRSGRSKELRGGATVRVIDIPADRAHGAFDQPADEPNFDPAAFAERMQEMASTYHGTAGPAFVKALIQEKVTGSAVRQAVNDFVTSVLSDAASDKGQARRVARKFAPVAVAGLMAIGAEIVDWDADAFAEGMKGLFHAWANAQGKGSTEEKALFAKGRLFWEQYGESRFDNVEQPDLGRERPVNERAGYKQYEPNGWVWYTFPEYWNQEIFPGVGRKAAALYIAHGILERGTEHDRPTQRVELGKLKRQSFYVINEKIFNAGE
jgi:uncharacterized protein (DUF927 family)